MPSFWIGQHRTLNPPFLRNFVAEGDERNALEAFNAHLAKCRPEGYEGPESVIKATPNIYHFRSGEEWFLLTRYSVGLTEIAFHHARQAFWNVVGTEWPHCNGQAGCWTHTESRWCACSCRWCRVARKIRPHYHAASTEDRS